MTNLRGSARHASYLVSAAQASQREGLDPYQLGYDRSARVALRCARSAMASPAPYCGSSGSRPSLRFNMTATVPKGFYIAAPPGAALH